MYPAFTVLCVAGVGVIFGWVSNYIALMKAIKRREEIQEKLRDAIQNGYIVDYKVLLNTKGKR